MSVDAQDYWFDGPVADAIGLVNQRNCILLVYIYDDSEKAQVLDKTLNDSELSFVIKEKSVALRMKKDSEEANMFGQYYPTAHTPIVYFIQHGTIRDFAVETVTKQEMIDKLNSMVTPKNANNEEAVATNQQQQEVVVNQPSNNNNATEQPTAIHPTAASTDMTATDNTAAISDEAEKKEKIKNQLAEARKLREEREKQEAKEREIKRREQGRELERAKQERIDRENKIYFEKIKKEKKADEEHKKKVREQIARDRAEKMASRRAEKERQVSIDSVTEQSSGSKRQQSYNTCNLNIRQLDGSTIRNQFNADNTLSVVREWINENRTDGSSLYRLSAQFPTRTFTESDDTELLSSLNLCPSATIIMKPAKKKGGNVISDSSSPNILVGFASSSFHFFYSLVFNLFQIITGLLSTLFPRNGLAAAPENDQQREQLRSLRGGQRLGGESSATASSSATIKRRNPYSSHVNTLHEDEDKGSDDDGKKTTYNGNSVNHE